MTFSIIISALGVNLHKINHWISSEILEKIDDFIIVVQDSSGYNQEINNLKDLGCKVIIDNKLGLSRSRNLGIDACESYFFWILDDDVYTDLSMIDIILKTILSHKADIYGFRIAKDKNKNLYKKYSDRKNIDRLHSLKLSSIELVVSNNFIKNKLIRFNENFGLGSKYPNCEENLFLLDCFDKGAQIIHIPEIIVIHSNLGSGYLKIDNNALIAKGYVCRKLGLIGFFVILRWYIRIIVKYQKFSSIKYFIKGYRLRKT